MDAHLFRRLCDSLLPRLMGARMEKIHAPGPNVLVFALHGGREHDGKRHLVLKSDRKNPLLFVSQHRVPVNAQPPAFAMLLRKHLSGQRITKAVSCWTDRRLHLCFSGPSPVWLTLDLKTGASLSFTDPPEFTEPEWPESVSRLADGELRLQPVITPALRRTLPYLDPLDADALLMDLQAGGGDVFLYEDGRRCIASAWPLPPGRLEALGGSLQEQCLEDPLEALARAGEKEVWEGLAARSRENAARPFAAEAARLHRLMKKLDDDERRLQAMCGRKKDALLLQRSLHLFGAHEKAAAATVPDDEGNVTMQLDPRLTVRENMEEFFHKAARGRRGLEHLARRRGEVADELARAEAAEVRALAAVSGAEGAALPAERRAKTGGGAQPRELPRQVQAFRSSDGFLILRGRDTKGNALALKLAAPHDYWMHTANGPSAHVIIRRDHAGQDVPERTLREAGVLAALKSWQKDQGSADIQYSLAKYIHPMKKAAPGMVRIDKSEGAFTVKIDTEMEGRLASV